MDDALTRIASEQQGQDEQRSRRQQEGHAHARDAGYRGRENHEQN
jgi:hypothetical protein